MATVCQQNGLGGAGRRAMTSAGAWCLIVLLAGIPWFGFLQAAPPRSSKNPTDLASYDALITPEDRGHWAFQPIKPPRVPAVKNTDLGAQPDRSVRAGQARGTGVVARAGGRAAGRWCAGCSST